MVRFKYLNEIFKVLPTPSLLLLPDGSDFTIVAVNDAYLTLNCCLRNQIIGKSFFIHFSEHPYFLKPEWKTSLAKVLVDKIPDKIATQEFIGNDPAAKQKILYLDVAHTPMLNRLGEVEYIIQSITDVTQFVDNKRKEQAAFSNLESLLQTVEGIVWESEAASLHFTFISDQVENILGYTPEEWGTEPGFWENHLHPDDREATVRYFKSEIEHSNNHTLDYRIIRADGNYVWIKHIVTIINEPGKPKLLRGLMVDITATKRLSELEYLEKKILELNARKNVSLREVLSAYLKGIEATFSKMKCSVLQVKNDHLYNWAAPSLAKIYIDAIEALPIGKTVGSCGAAAFLKQKVVVSDVRNDLRWTKHQKIALKANFRACWCYPIIDSEGNVMATFGLYFEEPKLPNEEELKFIERTTALLKMIIEGRKISENLQETTQLMMQGQELAHFGNWAWDLPSHSVTWSDSLYEIYGLKKTEYKASFEGYLDLLHLEDKERTSIIIGGVLSTKIDASYEERIVRPNGEIRHLQSWAKLIVNEKGSPMKLIGACLDITESKIAQEELLSSEARLKSLVDAQTNYVMRIDFKGRFTYCNKKYKEDFGWIYEDKDLIGAEGKLAVAPYHYQQLFDLAENCINNPNTVYQAEIDKPQQEGGFKSTFWHFMCLTDVKGAPTEIQCIGIDVNERKLAEDALKISNERYKYVNMATNDAMYDWEIERDHINWGDGFQRLFGYTIDTDKYPQKKWLSEMHPADVLRLESNVKKQLEDKTQHTLFTEYEVKKAGKDYAYIEDFGYILRNDQGKAVRIIGVMRDITERKKVEAKLNTLHKKLETHLKILAVSNKELEATQKRYKNLFHLSPQPMWVFEAKSLKFLDVNDAAVKFYGYSREEFLSLDVTKIRPPEDISKLMARLQKMRQRVGLVYHGIFRHKKKNGEIVLMDIQSNNIEFNENESYLILASDVTERVNYVGAVEKQNKKLKEIAWMQSHVVRAPLTRIMSLVNLIKTHQSSDEEKMELLEYLLTSAYELDEIVRDISGKTEQAELNAAK